MPHPQPLLERLVACDTTAGGSNLALIGLVEEQLDAHDVPHERVLHPDGDRAGLVARIGPAVEGGVVLSAHTDCVPCAGQPWSRDPFRLHEEDGRLYGRGATDMKGFLAVILAALPELVRADLQRPVLLALSYDEELGAVGAPDLAAHLLATQPRPAAVIVGEPTRMEVVSAHKGVRAFETVVEGVDGHSSQPHRAANAVAAAGRIAAFVDELAARCRAAGGDERFDPPYTTFNLAMISGGQAINIVPRRCELTWEYRPVPADDGEDLRAEVDAHVRDEVLPRLRAATGRGEIHTRALTTARALAAERDGAAEALARRLTGDEGPSRTVAFATDGGAFQAAGLSTVVCGPGSIDQAHQPDEYLEVAQLAACEAFVGRLAEHLSA